MSFITCFEIIVKCFSYKIAHLFKQKLDCDNWNNSFKGPTSSSFFSFFKLQTMVFQKTYTGFVKRNVIKELKLSRKILLCVKASDLLTSQVIMLSWETEAPINWKQIYYQLSCSMLCCFLSPFTALVHCLLSFWGNVIQFM